MEQRGEKRWQGTPVCRGIAIGSPFLLRHQLTSSTVEMAIGEKSHPSLNKEREVMRYRAALQRCRGDIALLRQQMENEKISQGVSILESHLEILEDPLITEEIELLIHHGNKTAEQAFRLAIDSYKKQFDAMRDTFFRSRFADIEDVARRILSHLLHGEAPCLASLPPATVVFAKELSASDAAEADPERIAAFVTESGGVSTHAAIIAKAKAIPYIGRIPFEEMNQLAIEQVIIDGRTGELIINPRKETLDYYRALQERLQLQVAELEEGALENSETCDGLQMRVCANIETTEEVTLLHQYGGAGIGLLRTENLFLFNDTFPSEEEQTCHYSRFVQEMEGLPITIRTFDIGGDKSFMGRIEGSGEPFFVGCRAIRFLLQEKTIFKRQLRAILRASVGGVVQLLFPMISSLPELYQAKELLEEARQELVREGVLPEEEKILVGSMIEIPSAALIADILAKECDFLSIGTNDLIHYSLAVDRSHQPFAPFHAQCHPCLLRLIKMVVFEANLNGIPVSVCGEIASDPRFTAPLLGLGVHELSVPCRYLPLIKRTIRYINAIDAVQLAEEALTLGTSQEVQQLFADAYRKLAPEDYFYNY